MPRPYSPDLMMSPFERLLHRFEPTATFLRAWPLMGGVSAQVTALAFRRVDGTEHIWVVRQHGEIDRTNNPRITEEEFALLRSLKAQGLPVPTPFYVDSSGDILPTPYLVQAYIDGASEFALLHQNAYAAQLAAALAQIHRADTGQLGFLRQQMKDVTRLLEAPSDPIDEVERRLRSALTRDSAWITANTPGLLHGDYWPGNVMWRAGQLVAVIDWEDAALGNPLLDVANMRLELAFALGMEAVQPFTAHYQALMPQVDSTVLPYWEAFIALRVMHRIDTFSDDPATLRQMHTAHAAFTEQALIKLAAD
ncbi:MAG: hypothetical protein OHK0046_08830 [Anaerolineae bacterium]